jgi:hypothetical protein
MAGWQSIHGNDNGQTTSWLLKFLVTSLVASSRKCCFTGSITKAQNLNHIGVRALLTEEILTLETRGIGISVILPDGATFHTESIQSHNLDSVLFMS